jgi:hypothetical protein
MAIGRFALAQISERHLAHDDERHLAHDERMGEHGPAL